MEIIDNFDFSRLALATPLYRRIMGGYPLQD